MANHAFYTKPDEKLNEPFTKGGKKPKPKPSKEKKDAGDKGSNSKDKHTTGK